MKKKIFMACAALVVSAAAVVGVKAYNYYSMSPLMRANLEALSNSESNGNNCPDHNYVPNRYIIAEMKTIQVQCTKRGELNVTAYEHGIIKGGYEKGNTYEVVFEVKNCSGRENGACCDQRNVGVKLVKC